jgi:catechol 2,3-dioxygenase-like lactoylglutathione lyase family enzyme
MSSSPPVANLLVLRSPDIQRAATFYQALGLHFTLERHGRGAEHFSASIDGFVFELYPIATDQAPTTSVRIGFRVNTVDELIPQLLHLGAVLLTAPHDSDWGRRAVVQDLDGHTVELLTRSEVRVS